MKAEAEKLIDSKGITTVVRAVRPQIQPNRIGRTDYSGQAWAKDLKLVLKESDEEAVVLAPQEQKNFGWEDSCFSSKRIPGPWLEKVVMPSDSIAPNDKLTFVVEVCADHLGGRVRNAMSSVVPKPSIDINVVPSAGAQLGEANVCTDENGFAFNCDGWNAPMFAAGPRERGAKVITEKADGDFPFNSGNNPLFPHSELWKMGGGGKGVPVTTSIKVIKVERDISALFAYKDKKAGELHIYPRQELPLV
jgi:hypothetical protein